nr:hypothetical protein HK105_004232 [Polyrhizophydium stewartii]
MPSQVVTLSRGYGQSGGGTPRRNPGGGTLSRPNGLTAMPPVAGSAPTGTLYLSQPSSLSSSGYPLSSLDSMLPYEPVSQSVSYYSSLSQQPMAQYASMSQPSDQSGRSATFTKQPIQSQPTQKQGLLSFSKQKYQITEADIEATRQKLDRILGL